MGHVVLLTINMLLRPAVVAMLWLWFAVPLGAPDLSWLHVMGLMLLVELFQGHSQKRVLDELEYSEDQDLKYQGFRLAISMIGLGLGWGVHTAM